MNPRPESRSTAPEEISRERLAELLNEDLSREYQAIIAYVVYSQVLSGAQYMDIAAQLEIHAKQELDHALTISRQIDYLGKMPTVSAKPVRTSHDPKDMLRYDLENETDTIRNYRDRIRQCEALGEYAMAEQIRRILSRGTGPSNRSGNRARRACPGPKRGSVRSHQGTPSKRLSHVRGFHAPCEPDFRPHHRRERGRLHPPRRRRR